MLKTKFSKLLTLTFVFISFSFLGYYAISLFENNKKDYYLKVQSELLQAKYETSYKNYKIMTSDIFSMYSKNKKIISLFSQAKDANRTTQSRLRTQMYNSLAKNYKRLSNMGISQVHFQFPTNKSFLRMYQPTKFGDDLSKTRHTIRLTNKLQNPHEGFESCQAMSGFRFVYPVFNKTKEHIGSIEISYEGEQLLQSITDDFIYDAHILVSKKMLDFNIKKEHLKSHYKDSWEAKDYYIDTKVHKNIGHVNFYNKISTKELQKEIASKIKTQNTFSITTKYNYQNIILTFLPIHSANGIKNVSYIVTYSESDYLSNVKTEENYIKTVYFVVITMFFLFGIYIIFSQEKLKQLALYDELTKLPNRTLFTIEFQNEINRALRYKTKIALMFLDLDGFKAVNDTYGHTLGDKLLRIISDIITSQIRKSDIAARVGGDEFIIMLTDVKDIKTTLRTAQDIIHKINEDIIIEKEIIQVGASIGISIFPQDSENPDTLIKYADQMMYKSKERGKNQITIYNKEEKI